MYDERITNEFVEMTLSSIGFSSFTLYQILSGYKWSGTFLTVRFILGSDNQEIFCEVQFTISDKFYEICSL